MQTLNTGSLKWATALFFGYLYMVASWGGYSFIANLLPIHCLACIVFQRVSARLYVAYAPWVILGALAAGAVRCAAFVDGKGWQWSGIYCQPSRVVAVGASTPSTDLTTVCSFVHPSVPSLCSQHPGDWVQRCADERAHGFLLRIRPAARRAGHPVHPEDAAATLVPGCEACGMGAVQDCAALCLRSL
jgi:hypothetical protein